MGSKIPLKAPGVWLGNFVPFLSLLKHLTRLYQLNCAPHPSLTTFSFMLTPLPNAPFHLKVLSFFTCVPSKDLVRPSQGDMVYWEIAVVADSFRNSGSLSPRGWERVCLNTPWVCFGEKGVCGECKKSPQRLGIFTPSHPHNIVSDKSVRVMSRGHFSLIELVRFRVDQSWDLAESPVGCGNSVIEGVVVCINC